MANLKLEIIVDDKGGVKVLRQFGDEAKKAGTDGARSFDMASSAASQLTAGIRTLIGAYAGYKGLELVKDTALAAARYETLGVVMTVVGKNAGYTASQMHSVSEALQKTGISMIESRNVLTRMTQAQLDLGNATKLARIAQDAAVIGNMNSSQAFETMIHGIQSGQIDVLRTIGINVNFEQSYKALAKQLGVSTESLSEQQKMQARANTVMEAGGRIAGTYEAAMNTAGKQISSFTRYVEDFQVEVGKAFGPATKAIITEATQVLKDFTKEVQKEEIQQAFEGIGKTAVAAFSDVIKISAHGVSFLQDVLGGWNRLPTIVQEVGIFAAVFGGAKGVAAITGISLIREWVGLMAEAIALAEKGKVSWTQIANAGNVKELRNVVSAAGSSNPITRLKSQEAKLLSDAAEYQGGKDAFYGGSEKLLATQNELKRVRAEMQDYATPYQDSWGLEQWNQRQLAANKPSTASTGGGSDSAAKKALKAAEDEAAVYQKMFNDQVEMYTFGFKMEKEAADAVDDRIKLTISGIEKAEKAEQEKSEMLGQMAMVDQKLAEGTAKDKADAYRTMYGDMKGDTQQFYSYQLTALNKERDNYEKLTGDKVLADKWYLNQKKKLDQDLALSSNKFFKGIEVGYERMLDDQMTWAKGGLAIFNSFANSGKSTISNVLFDGIKGDLKSFNDYWDSFFDSLLRTFTDTVAEMATQQLADAAVKPLVNFVGGAAGAAGNAAWDWLSEIDWFHAGSQMVGNQLADQRGNLSSDDLLAVLKRGEIVVPPDISDDIRSGNYSSLAAWMGGSFSAPDWLSVLYSSISSKAGKYPFQRDEQGNVMGIDPYSYIKDVLGSMFSNPQNITKEIIAQKISNSGFAYISGSGSPYQLVNTGKEGRDYAFRANMETIDALSKTYSGVSTISIPAQISRQLSMMISGGSGGSSNPFGGLSGMGVPGGSGIGNRMLSGYIGTAIQGLMSGQVGAYGLMSPAARAIMEAMQESYGTETGSGRYSNAANILGGLITAFTGNPAFGMLANLGISGYGNYSYTKQKADILGMNPGIANALAGGWGGESSMGGSGIPGGYGWREGGISRGAESGYMTKLHGTEAVVPLPNGRSIPVEIKGGRQSAGDSRDLPPVQINLTLDGRVIARALYKQSRAGVKAIHDRGITNV